MEENKEQSPKKQPFDIFDNKTTGILMVLAWFAGFYLLFCTNKNEYGYITIVNLFFGCLSMLLFLIGASWITFKMISKFIFEYGDSRLQCLIEFLNDNIRAAVRNEMAEIIVEKLKDKFDDNIVDFPEKICDVYQGENKLIKRQIYKKVKDEI